MANRKRRIKTKYPTWIFFILLAVAELAVFVFFGFQKAGFHEDEYYTYYSANRTAGLFTPDREWEDTNRIEDEFIVLPGERLTYLRIATVQSWDVHPPLYYDIFHTIAGFWPGGLSKWPGLITNMVAFVICFALLNAILKRLMMPVPFRLFVLALWGFHPVTVSMMMFIRMYMWLTVWVLACAHAHVRFASEITSSRLVRMNLSRIFTRFFLPMLIITFCGFLTQYYYLVFHVFIGIAFVLFLIFGRHDFGLTKLSSVSLYIGFHLLSYAAAIALYPSSVAHIVRGYRGKEAAEAFLSIDNTPERFRFFFGLINDTLFWGAGLALLIVLAVMWIMVYLFRRQQLRHQEMSLLSAGSDTGEWVCAMLICAGAVGYILVVTKTALLLGASSNRYLYPVYPLLIALVLFLLYAASSLLQEIGDDGDTFRNTVIRERIWIALRSAAALFMAVMTVLMYVRGGSVLFLYPEDADLTANARAHGNEGAVIVYNNDTPHNIWRLTKILIEYPEVYFVNSSNASEINDEKILWSEAFDVYAADSEGRDRILAILATRNEVLKEGTITRPRGSGEAVPEPMIYNETGKREMWTVYRFETAGGE